MPVLKILSSSWKHIFLIYHLMYKILFMKIETTRNLNKVILLKGNVDMFVMDIITLM